MIQEIFDWVYTFWWETTHNKLSIALMVAGLFAMPDGPWYQELGATFLIVWSAVRWHANL